MKTKHTPGPWKVGSHMYGCDHVTGPRDELGATVICNMPGAGIDVADNARLIAAAPDLLAALIDAISLLDSIAATLPDKAIGRSSVNVAASARAAIAKAEGKS